MVQRVSGFLVVLLLMFFGSMNGQRHHAPGISVPGLKRVHFQQSVHPFQSRFTNSKRISLPGITAVPRINLLYLPTATFYVQNLGFFCKQEIRLDKVTGVPIRFRLGSREYVDRLEYGARYLPSR